MTFFCLSNVDESLAKLFAEGGTHVLTYGNRVIRNWLCEVDGFNLVHNVRDIFFDNIAGILKNKGGIGITV
ncbi:Uncharacterised protein [Mycobacteroides abscessus subsp. abscessus]|nr:Uncharacterised protein [Mycobacteroides abscessus subsp. abscessus]